MSLVLLMGASQVFLMKTGVKGIFTLILPFNVPAYNAGQSPAVLNLSAQRNIENISKY